MPPAPGCRCRRLEPAGVEEQVLTAQLGGEAVDVPDQPADGVARRERPAPRAHRRDRRRRRRAVPAKPSACSDAAPVRRRRRHRARSGVAQTTTTAQSMWAPRRRVVATDREAVGECLQVGGAVRPVVRFGHGHGLDRVRPGSPPRAPRSRSALGRRLRRPAGPVVHRPTAGDERRADLGVALDVEAGDRQASRQPGGRRRRSRIAERSRRGPVGRRGTRRRVAWCRRSCCRRRRGCPTAWHPAAGLAVRISGTTQAAAPGGGHQPTSARGPGASKKSPGACITRCNRRCPHISIRPLPRACLPPVPLSPRGDSTARSPT